MRTVKCTLSFPSYVFMELINHEEFHFLFSKGKVKVKLTLEQSTKTQ
jgi:hypothetical protein